MKTLDDTLWDLESEYAHIHHMRDDLSDSDIAEDLDKVIEEAKQQIKADILEIVGKQYQGDDGNGNEFVYTDDLRTKLKDYFGIKEDK